MRDVLTVKRNLSGVRRLKSRDHAQGSSLAAARRAKQTKELAALYLKRHIRDRARRAVSLGNILKGEK
jgi:hypothetical protein